MPAEKSAPIRSIPPDASSEEDSAALPGLEVLEDIFDPRRKPAVREPSNVVLPAVVEPESPPELHILEELLSDGGGAKSHGRDGAARGVVDPIERGRSRGAVKLGSSDTVRSKGAGSSQAGRLVGSLQRRGGPASEGGIEHGNGESTSKEQEGYSRSALEAALRTASGSRGGKGAGGGGGLSRRPSDPPSKELADASPFVKDGRKAQTSYGGGVGKEAEVERGPSKGESKRNGVVGRRAVRTTGSQAGGNSVRVGNRVDTKDSSVPGAWAQWLNSVSERKRAEEQNGVKKNVGMQTGDFEGTRGQEILEGRGLGEGYGVRGGVGRGLERLSGSAAESGQEFGSERGGGSEWGPGRAPQRGWETLPEERGGEVPLRLASREVPGLDDQLESVWSSEGDGEGLQTGRRTFAAGSERNLGYSPEESRTTEDPFLRRRRLQYESLSPSQLFGEEPFDAVATGSGARETGLQSGEGRRQGEVFAGEDVWSVEDDDAVRGKSVGLVQGGSRHAVEKGELEKRGPSRKGAAAIAQRGEGEEIGTGRAWAVDTGLGSNEQAAAGVGSDKQAARKGRLESGLRGGQPAARARSAGERGGSDGGSVSGFEGPPQAARRGRMDVSERQGHVAETEVMKDISERGGDDRKWREAERARSKEKAWAAWLEFSSGGDRSPQEMSQFLAKWTAESVSGENGKEEETWEEPGSASSEAVRRLEGVSGSVTAIGGVEEYGSDADWEGPEGSYSGFAERAASGKVRGAAQRTPGVARSESRGSERGGGVIHKAQSSRGVKEAGRPGVEILGEGKPEGIAYGSREGVLRGGGPDGALGDPRIGGVRTSESTALEGPVNVRQRAGEPPFAAKPSRETWTEKPDASGESQSEADVSAALGTARRGADVSEVRNDGAAARADQGMTSEEALEWGVNEGADPDWVGDDQLGADTWQALEVEDEDDIVQPVCLCSFCCGRVLFYFPLPLSFSSISHFPCPDSFDQRRLLGDVRFS